MFERLFMESGLTLDRLRAFLEVASAGSIVQAANEDPVRQSQFSRQIKELEEFFHVRLLERHGKGIRLTKDGLELARISRFFLLGLSKFQRGSLAKEQTFRIGASASFIDRFLLPTLLNQRHGAGSPHYSVETATDDDIERRLHDLTLDFGIVSTEDLSRPLQAAALGEWRLNIWVPKNLCRNQREAIAAFHAQKLPMALPKDEWPPSASVHFKHCHPMLTCNNFLAVRTALEQETLAGPLPDYFSFENKQFFPLLLPSLDAARFQYRLAWNPRMLRLNPRAGRWQTALLRALPAGLRL